MDDHAPAWPRWLLAHPSKTAYSKQAQLGPVPPATMLCSWAKGSVCLWVATRHSGTGEPAVGLGDASPLTKFLLPSIVMQARLMSATLTLHAAVCSKANAWDGHQGQRRCKHSVPQLSSEHQFDRQCWTSLAYACRGNTSLCLAVQGGHHLECGPWAHGKGCLVSLALALPAGVNRRGSRPCSYIAHNQAAPASGLPAGRMPC